MAAQTELLQPFVRAAADQEVLWTLRDGHGWCVLVADGKECVPVWSNHQDAESFAVDEFEALRVESIPVHTYVEQWAGRLEDECRFVAVTPKPRSTDNGLVIEPGRLANALKKALAELEPRVVRIDRLRYSIWALFTLLIVIWPFSVYVLFVRLRDQSFMAALPVLIGALGGAWMIWREGRDLAVDRRTIVHWALGGLGGALLAVSLASMLTSQSDLLMAAGTIGLIAAAPGAVVVARRKAATSRDR
jgi:hypothetical protein